MDEEKIEYEYTETNSALKPGGIETCNPIFPDGLGWQFQEKIAIGDLAVFRWKREVRSDFYRRLTEAAKESEALWETKKLLDC
jgi:hypothetical protein